MERSEKAQYVVMCWRVCVRGVGLGWLPLINYFVCVCRERGAFFLVKLQGALAINPGHQIRP